MAYDPNNIFARMVRGEIPCIRVYEDADTIAFMDIMPQADGHTLVIPKVAGENLYETSPESVAAAMRTTQKVARAVQKAFAAPGVIVTQFNGATAGQTVFHLHFHIVPVYTAGSWRPHARDKADPAVLEAHATRIRAALGAA
ncbi:MAG TPA: HIT family protein [Steroidobacteraceae bacterium]|nr:HIT family protein [Steroidobacteraceae bacterium]